MIPWAHSSPQPKQQIDRFSRFCTAHSRKCLYFTMGDPFPQNCPFSWGNGDPIFFMIPWGRLSPQSKLHHDWFGYFRTWAPLSPKIAPSHGGSGPPCKTQFLGPIRAHRPNAISVSSAVFPQTTVESPYTLQWDAHSPPKICPSHGGSEPPSNTWSLGPTQVLNPNGISIGSAVFAGLTSVTDRQTDHSVSSNRPHLHT